ncbi:MAG: YeeE/YedE family protein [Deltaproteobacteria bacterium]|nr:YeeE/YedE family protein [Deltaproteobacteria bacterium]
MNKPAKRYINPYLGGMLLGVLLVMTYLLLGTGLGASGGLARIAASIEGIFALDHVRNSAYFGQWGDAPMRYYLVFMLIGVFVGGGISAFLGKRLKRGVEKGAAASIKRRMTYALGGGILIGFASRLVRGCTSGQALSGGALLLTGSLVFVFSLFVSGYISARWFKEQWHD